MNDIINKHIIYKYIKNVNVLQLGLIILLVISTSVFIKFAIWSIKYPGYGYDYIALLYIITMAIVMQVFDVVGK